MFFIILGNLEPRPLACAARTTNGPSRTRAALEIPAAAYPTTRYRAPLPDAAHAIAAEAIWGGRWQERSAVDGWTAVYDQDGRPRAAPTNL